MYRSCGILILLRRLRAVLVFRFPDDIGPVIDAVIQRDADLALLGLVLSGVEGTIHLDEAALRQAGLVDPIGHVLVSGTVVESCVFGRSKLVIYRQSEGHKFPLILSLSDYGFVDEPPNETNRCV